MRLVPHKVSRRRVLLATVNPFKAAEGVICFVPNSFCIVGGPYMYTMSMANTGQFQDVTNFLVYLPYLACKIVWELDSSFNRETDVEPINLYFFLISRML